MVSGIYKIFNTVTEKCYVGSAKDIHYRWRKHQEMLRRGKHHSIKLQRSWDKHGGHVWQWAVLEECLEDTLLVREQFYLDALDACRNGYNMSETAERVTMSESGRRRVAESNRRRVYTEQERLNRSQALKGKPAWNKGIPFPEKVKAKLRASAPKHKSLEHRQHIGDAQRGVPKKPESIEKQRSSLKGHKQSEETKSRRRATWARRRSLSKTSMERLVED